MQAKSEENQRFERLFSPFFLVHVQYLNLGAPPTCHLTENNGTFSSGSSGCFLTSACCKYKGLSDDCEELQILRQFRDSYLREKAYGPELIKCYYEDAPEIVAAIDKSDKREEIYEEIYSKVLQIKEFIEEKKYEEAVVEYMFMLYKVRRVIR